MTEPLARQAEPASPSQLHLLETEGHIVSALDSPKVSAWAVLFGALSFAAGHGLFLALALTQLERIPNVVELGGSVNAIVVLWFVAAVPAALVTFFRRRQIVLWSESRLRRVAALVLGITLVMFVMYVRKMVMA